MTTQYHNPDTEPFDDLTYYETELPAVIAGVRRGEKWEYKAYTEDRWYHPGDQSRNFLECQINTGYRVRLAPVPVVRPWSEPADVPVNCWIRWKSEPSEIYAVTFICQTGIGVYFSTTDRSDGNHATWSVLAKYCEHSTDLRNWSDCVKPEGGK